MLAYALAKKGLPGHQMADDVQHQVFLRHGEQVLLWLLDEELHRLVIGLADLAD